jgi:hypothetical protein
MTLAHRDYYEERDKVVRLFLEGKRQAAISRSTGIQPKDVKKYIEEFHAYAKDNVLLQERGMQVVQEFDHQQNRLIEELWKAVDEADDNGDYKTKGVLLKTLHDIQKGRVDTLQKAGMLSDAAMGDELAAMEEKHEILIAILKKVSAGCNRCKVEVARELAKVTGKAETIVVVEGE